MTVGDYLLRCRLGAGVKQHEIASLIDTTAQYISNVERSVNKPATKYLEPWCKLVRANKNTVFKLMMVDYRTKVREGLGM